jgi:hypothetical protein
MLFIKKHYVLIGLALVIVLNAVLTYFEVSVPSWAMWLLIMSIFGFVSWQIAKTFMDEYRKTKKQKGKRQIIILGYVVGALGVALFCGVYFSGLPQRLFPG